uniref:CSON008344 protein n=1 Tax=Culicoides sonorensis TaxID=179676 RepID=A0A336LEV6_CULSO
MPLFDTALQEKAIIFEIGHAYTKLGFAGENSPRFIIPTKVENSANGTSKDLFDYKDNNEFYEQVITFIQKLFFKYILVNPKDKKIVMVESILCPTIIRETFASVLYLHFEVNTIFFVPLHLAALSTLAIDTALVIDIGYKEAIVIPVFSGVQVLNAWQAQALGAEAIHDEIKGQLILNGIKEEYLTPKVIEDIKARLCFVTNLERSRKYREKNPPPPCPDIDYPIKGDEIIKIPGVLRETAFEVLFPEDNDRLGLPYIILDAILKCPIDMRRQLAENIFIIGGSSIIMGLTDRIKHELLELVQSDVYRDRLPIKAFKFHTGISQPNFTGWLGGSIYGNTDLLNQNGLSKETYLKTKKLPDWSNFNGEETRSA